MRTLFLFRHTLKGVRPFNNVISDEGRELAGATGARYVRGLSLANIFVSPMLRTTQTAMEMVRGARDVTLAKGPVVEDLLGGVEMEEWIPVCEQSEEVSAMLRIAPDFIAARQIRLAEAYHRMAMATPIEATSLVVSHAPCTEVAIHALTGVTIAPLRECEGAILDRDEWGKFTLRKELRRAA